MQGFRSDRRVFLIGTALLLPALRAAAADPAQAKASAAEQGAFAEIEKRTAGRLGVAVLDTASGRRIGYRAAERFPMCSTFKFLAAATVLQRVDRGRESLDRRVAYGPGDLLEHAPVTRQHAAEGGMSVSALCAAAVEYSDNTAANLLLRAVGGPGAVTRYARSLGDAVTRLDRTEPTLNEALPGDPRDTTSPAAMLDTMRTLLLGQALTPASRQKLEDWLVGNTTGAARLRAGVPAGWRVGDKTGTGRHGATNDIAILWPPGRAPLLITAYLAESSAPAAEREAALAEVGRIIAESF